MKGGSFIMNFSGRLGSGVGAIPTQAFGKIIAGDSGNESAFTTTLAEQSLLCLDDQKIVSTHLMAEWLRMWRIFKVYA